MPDNDMTPAEASDCEADPLRGRIIGATFDVLMERGYAGASTNEIARRARISKRELYALFGSKEGVLSAMIGGRAARMRQPLNIPEASDPPGLAEVLTRFGVALLREGANPAVMAVTRLAIAEAERSPGLARRLDEDGRRPTRAALADFLRRAVERGLLGGAEPGAMGSQFLALLWEDLQMLLLLRLAEPPPPEETEQRATRAVAALLRLYATPVSEWKGSR